MDRQDRLAVKVVALALGALFGGAIIGASAQHMEDTRADMLRGHRTVSIQYANNTAAMCYESGYDVAIAKAAANTKQWHAQKMDVVENSIRMSCGLPKEKSYGP